MDSLKVALDFCGGAQHLSQIGAGFQLLQEQGLLEVTQCRFARLQMEDGYPHNVTAQARLSDGRVIGYDMDDGYQQMRDMAAFDANIGRLSKYCKRSYDPAMHKNLPNAHLMRPLGLNYLISCKDNPFDAITRRAAIAVPEDYESHVHYRDYRVLFYTRLWESGGITERTFMHPKNGMTLDEAKICAKETIDGFNRVNNTRIECIRALRRALGDRFCGGVVNTPLARRIAPDLVLIKEKPSRAAFRNMLKENFICIANDGLYRSIGWKMAEYMAASRAVVCETPFYTVPAPFAAGRNFLPFQTADECVAQATRLLDDVELTHEMEDNNRAYYRAYIRPDGMIWHSLIDP
ncbi:MAG: hypothetical protein LBB67_07100 [Oscillospiraceae bacterium]|nr:hypothetical protein [Oscillospiraceae bacterium]